MYRHRYWLTGFFLVVVLGMMGDFVGAQAQDKKAKDPSPKDGATDTFRDGTILSWSPGQTTPKYDVYFGTVKKYVERVDRANPLYVVASLGQTAKTFNPGRLKLGATYYWRVDEVDDTKPDAVKVVKGDVWSFMVEVPALPVGNVTATASCSNDGSKPEKTVDGSGLSAAGTHSVDGADMWLSCVALPKAKDPKDPNGPKETPATWIQFQFAKVQRLYQMSVWNWNAKDTLEYGMKEITVQYSTNGTDWKAVGDFPLAKGAGTKEYGGAKLSLAGVTATHIRITAKSGYGTSGQYGLSEVSFTGEPVYARDPSPASGAQDVPLDATLSWRVGREAASHKVYISTDKAAVEKGTATSFTGSANSLKLSSLEVALGKTYYWRVDEVNDAKTPKSFAGDIWSFRAVNYLVVDDFEASSLADRWAFEGGVSGAVEKGVVRTGKQSLALSFLPNYNWHVFEGRATLSKIGPTDWTKYGINTLLIYLRGVGSNRGAGLSLRINDTDLGLLYKPVGLRNTWWDCWAIDVAALKSAVGAVGSITLRLTMSSDAKGTLYVDDIRLSAQTSLPADILDGIMELNDAVATKGQFDTLLAAIFAADSSVVDLLSGEKTYTVFAPTNKAFAAAGFSVQQIAAMDKAVLTDILKYHIAEKAIPATAKEKTIATLEGGTLLLDSHVLTDDIGGRAVITASRDASNGVIHTVSAVLMPFTTSKIVDVLKSMNKTGDLAGQFDTLLAAIEAAAPAVRDTLSKRSYTLFAPTDKAFAARGYDEAGIKKENQTIVNDILLYHLVSGRILEKDFTATLKTVQGGELKQSKGVLKDGLGNEAKVTGLDVEASNGVIHVVDAVLLPYATPPGPLFELVMALNKEGQLKGKFATLLAIKDAVDPKVLEQKMGTGACTLFAPTDAAFKAVGLDPNAVKALIAECKTNAEIAKAAKASLMDVLLYHLVLGRLAAKDALAAPQLKTLQGEILIPDSGAGILVGMYAGVAKITTPDLAADNGLVHVIDAALLSSPLYVRPLCEPELKLVTIKATIEALNKEGDHKGKFDTFLAVLVSVDKTIAEALSGKADNTLFIPTDEAFDKLDPKTDSLNEVVLADILRYHIAAGKLMGADVRAAKKITMLKGGDVQQADGTLTDNTGGKAKIVVEDIKASNGVIHVINAVLLPAAL